MRFPGNIGLAIMFFCCCFLFTNPPAFSQAEQGILLVDDDDGSFFDVPWRQGLQSCGKAFDVLDTRVTPATMETLKKYKIVLWVTGGRRGDLSGPEMDILGDYINGRGRVLVSGEYTGSALKWSWLDERSFGFSFRNNTFRSVRVKPEDTFIHDFSVSTDYGWSRWGKMTFSFFTGNGDVNNSGELTGMACGIENYAYGRKTVWLGFNLYDVFSSWDQRRIVQNSVYFLDWGLKSGISEYRQTFSGHESSLEERLKKREITSRNILQEFKNILDAGTKNELESAQALLDAEKCPELESLKKEIGSLIRFTKMHNRASGLFRPFTREPIFQFRFCLMRNQYV